MRHIRCQLWLGSRVRPAWLKRYGVETVASTQVALGHDPERVKTERFGPREERDAMEDADLRLDGNAAAGLLAGVFAFEVTTARAVCNGCGATAPVANLATYGLPMGAILRCPHCDTALIRLSRVANGYWLDLRGTRVLWVQTAD